MSDLTPPPLQRPRARQIPHAIPLRIESRRSNVKTGDRDKQRVSWRPVFLIALGIPISLAIGIALGPLLNASTRNASDMKGQPASLAESVDHHARSVPRNRSSGATRDAAAAYPVSNEPAVHARLVSAEADEDTAEPLLQDTQEADQNPPRSVKDDSTESQSADAAPPAAPVQSEKIVCSTAASGHPFGVGKVEILFGDGARPTVYPDQPILFDESDIRARFMVFDAEPVASDDSSPHAARRMTVHFLFLGDEPLEIRCATLGDVLLEDVTVVPEHNMALHARLLDEWWQTYSQRVTQLTGPARVAQQLLRRALARRLDLAMPPYPTDAFAQRPLASLEHQFERSLSTLLGIDSLLLAVPEPSGRRDESQKEIATERLPSPINALPVRFAGRTPRVEIEPIAYRVPEDCFYLRCGSLANYAWLRSFMTGWGGSLHEIVSLPTLDNPLRQRVETQLGISLGDGKK